MDKRTTILILAVVIILIIVGFLWWFFTARDGERSPSESAFDFFGFSGEEGPGFGGDGENGDGNGTLGDGEGADLPAMRQITAAPTAGIVALAVTDPEDETNLPAAARTGERPTTTVVRFVEKETGFVKEVVVDTMEERRLTNTTIPRVHEALWQENGQRVVLRYLGDDGQIIETFLARVPDFDPAGATTTELAGDFLPRNVEEVAVSPNNSGLIYKRTIEGEARFVQTDNNGSNRSTFFTFPFTEWLFQQTRSGDLFLTTKPSFAASGFLYRLNTAADKLEHVLGDAPGLTALVNPTGVTVLASMGVGDGLRSVFYDIETRETETVPVSTISEKCVWGEMGVDLYCGVPKQMPSARYPDAWYRGSVTFNDALWYINKESGVTRQIIDPANRIQQDVDITKPTLGPNSRYLIFIDKKDSSVWLVDLKQIEKEVGDSAAQEGG